MLVNKQTRQIVQVPNGKELSDHFLRQHDEYKQPQTYRGHPFFRLEARANTKK